MSTYAAVHVDPKGPGDARPTALQIVKDNDLEGKLAGKVAVITGGSSGIGTETVRALAVTSLKIFVTARDIEKAKATLGAIMDIDPITFVLMDHLSLESVREAAKTILANTDKINILVNNAGIMRVPDRQLSKDGFELQFATNHLSHFLLFQLLEPALIAASSPELQSRVINVTSNAHRDSGLNETGNYNFENGGYHPWLAYAHSKTANIYFSNEIERRYASRGVHSWSVHPGAIATNLGRYMTDEQLQGLLSDQGLAKYWKNFEQGAATTIWAAIGPELEGKGGKYLAHCAEAPLGEKEKDRGGYTHAKHTYDPEAEARLWKDSLVMVGIKED